MNTLHTLRTLATKTSADAPHGYSRRQLLAGLIATPVLATFVAACGDPNVEPAGSDPSVPANPSTTLPTGPVSIAHSADPETAIIRIGSEGGFVPVDTYFVNIPSLVISGDGRAFVPGAVPAIFPGPLIAPMGVRSISEAGIQSLLAQASAAGLLDTPPDYTADTLVADAPDTVVRFNVASGSFEHRAYALGFGVDDTGAPAEELTDARRTLLGYVLELGDLASTVGAAELGAEVVFEPAAYRLRATPVTEAELAGLEPTPTIVDWPSSTGLDLERAGDCAQLDAVAAGRLFTDADQLTHFRQGDAVYRIAVAGVLPGDPVC